MSGIGIAVAGGRSSSTPPAPAFSTGFGVFQSVTTGPLNVSGASGTSNNSDPAGNGERRFFLSVTNGTPPYTYSTTIASNPSGKLNITNKGGNFNYVTWTGFALNETQTISVNMSISDSAGNSGSGSASITIHRNNAF